MMASFMSFLSRRQTDRTTLTFGSSGFALKKFLCFVATPFTEESRSEQVESCLRPRPFLGSTRALAEMNLP